MLNTVLYKTFSAECINLVFRICPPAHQRMEAFEIKLPRYEETQHTMETAGGELEEAYQICRRKGGDHFAQFIRFQRKRLAC